VPVSNLDVTVRSRVAAAVTAILMGITVQAQAPSSASNMPQPDVRMNFFVSSVGSGRGGNLGGVVGADALCAGLAAAAGSQRRQWRAYLSAPASGAHRRIDARTRIGAGPWFNFRGVLIAATVAELHGAGNRIAAGTALNEHGRRMDTRHDILTGSAPDGTLAKSQEDLTCRGWTSAGPGMAMVGHADRVGGVAAWNSAHITYGCSLPALAEGGGNGSVYCFALD
jgi:hypothetical protein